MPAQYLQYRGSLYRLASGYTIMYHIGRRPAQPKPKKLQVQDRYWDEAKQRRVDRSEIDFDDPKSSPAYWHRDWLPEPLQLAVFLTTNPMQVAQYHGRWGNLYAYRVPNDVIAKNGGIHRFDMASELVVSAEDWARVKFLGKVLDRSDFDDWMRRFNRPLMSPLTQQERQQNRESTENKMQAVRERADQILRERKHQSPPVANQAEDDTTDYLHQNLQEIMKYYKFNK